jgi:hypothetical protein
MFLVTSSPIVWFQFISPVNISHLSSIVVMYTILPPSLNKSSSAMLLTEFTCF